MQVRTVAFGGTITHKAAVEERVRLAQKALLNLSERVGQGLFKSWLWAKSLHGRPSGAMGSMH
jgi:hypothetical protein